MPIYRTSLRMAHDTGWTSRRKWTTTFYFNVASAAAAAAALAVGWVSFLRNACDEGVFAYEVYATDLVEGTSDYVVQTIAPGDRRGTIAVGTRGEHYLTKACVRVDLTVAASRPSRKFWRAGLREGDVQDGVAIEALMLNAVETEFGDFIVSAGAGLVDVDGQDVTGLGRVGLTTREFGRTAGADVPNPPPLG